MKLTTEDYEIYAALTNTRNDLIASFANDFADVQNPESVTIRNNCIGMLNFDQECIDVPYYQVQQNPRAPDPTFVQMTANNLAASRGFFRQ